MKTVSVELRLRVAGQPQLKLAQDGEPRQNREGELLYRLPIDIHTPKGEREWTPASLNIAGDVAEYIPGNYFLMEVLIGNYKEHLYFVANGKPAFIEEAGA